MNALRVTVWGENVHEHKHPAVAAVYPKGMHTVIADGLKELLPAAEVTTATLQEPDHGLTEERLAKTDVATWLGHLAPGHGRGRQRRGSPLGRGPGPGGGACPLCGRTGGR